jgi:hypothetical protein
LGGVCKENSEEDLEDLGRWCCFLTSYFLYLISINKIKHVKMQKKT